MKESELMKFDWVMFDEENYEPYEIERVYMQVDHFNCGTVYGKTNRQSNGTYIAHCEEESMYSSREYSKVMPIPITPEILEKNGWKLDEEMSGDDPCFVLDLSDEDPNWMRNLYWANDVLYLGDYHYCDCFFVHHLQHALRLLGKDNHADTFKLN